MLVGEVREANAGTALPGNYPAAASVLVRDEGFEETPGLAAVRRRKANCFGFNSGTAEGSIGWLMRQAIQGEINHRPG